MSGPVIINDKHWVLLFISFKEKKVYYIDPFGTLSSDLNNVTSNVNLHFSTHCKRLKNFDFSPQQINHQKQKDTFNCGAHVCRYYEILAEGNLARFDENINIEIYREYIKTKLKSKSNIQACCTCGKSLKTNLIFFKSNMKYFECGHRFHLGCIKDKCVVCEVYN